MLKLILSSNRVDQLVSFLLFLVLINFFYFVFCRKRCKYNKLKKQGLKIPANVISIKKTNLSVGDDSSAIPILEIVFELEYPKDTIRKETVRYAFDRWERIPKTGDTITILVDKTNPCNFDIFKDDL